MPPVTKKSRRFSQISYKQPKILCNKQNYGLHWSRGQGWSQGYIDQVPYSTYSINYQWNDKVYAYLFGHSCPMRITESSFSHSKFSVSTLVEKTSTVQRYTDTSCTDLSNSFVSNQGCNFTYSNNSIMNMGGCEPGGGAHGCNINSPCTRVHVALSGQVSCLSCIFTTGQYSSLDYDDLSVYYTNIAMCSPSGCSHSSYDSQLTQQHGPHGQKMNNIRNLSLSFSDNVLQIEGGRDQTLHTNDYIDQAVMYDASKEANFVGQNIKVSSIMQLNTEIVERREFGFMPVTMTKHVYPLSKNSYIDCQDEALYLNKIHTMVRSYGCPNYKGARIPVFSGLNIKAWRQVLCNYDIPNLVEYLEFGFPLGVDYSIFNFKNFDKNHLSAIQRPEGVAKYFEIEVEKQAMFGPFDKPPFKNIHYSPLMARDKPDGGVRIIVDLSWPQGNSLNSCVPSDIYDDIPFLLKYPTIDQVVERIQCLGPSAMLFKVDLERAFRNLRVDPYAYPLLGLKWDDVTYVDVGVPFGLKTGAAMCQMCTDAITLTLRKRNVWLINYLDDYIGVAPPEVANNHFLALKNLLQYVGLPSNSKKVEEPSHIVTCLGIEINASAGTLKIPCEKLDEIKRLCNFWLTKKHASKNDLQKLVGKLIYIHRCVKPARLFINRILKVLRSCPAKGKYSIPIDMFKDIRWFTVFLQDFNGTINIHRQPNFTENIYVDACLTGVGAKYKDIVYFCEIPEFLRIAGSIVHFEAINILVTIRMWSQLFQDKSIIIWCDNWAVVNAFNNSKIRDSLLMATVRSVWLYTAMFNINLKVQHIRGKDNYYADILSRWPVYEHNNKDSIVAILKSCQWHTVQNSMFIPNFDI